MKYVLILAISITSVTAQAGWWKNFCERHLVGDDPYQFEHLTVEQLVAAYFTFGPSKVLGDEIQKRLAGELTYEERQMLKVTQ